MFRDQWASTAEVRDRLRRKNCLYGEAANGLLKVGSSTQAPLLALKSAEGHVGSSSPLQLACPSQL